VFGGFIPSVEPKNPSWNAKVVTGGTISRAKPSTTRMETHKFTQNANIPRIIQNILMLIFAPNHSLSIVWRFQRLFLDCGTSIRE